MQYTKKTSPNQAQDVCKRKQSHNTPSLKKNKKIKCHITWWHNQYKSNGYSVKNEDY